MNSFGERLADRLAAIMGSWRFILLQSFVLLAWVVWNAETNSFDPYPFILLNLALSFQAAYTGPIVLMSANRQAQIDRRRAMKNLIIDQQDHEVIIRLEMHLDWHFHQLRKELGLPPLSKKLPDQSQNPIG
jgi:uncharacterized membrane protein